MSSKALLILSLAILVFCCNIELSITDSVLCQTCCGLLFSEHRRLECEHVSAGCTIVPCAARVEWCVARDQTASSIWYEPVRAELWPWIKLSGRGRNVIRSATVEAATSSALTVRLSLRRLVTGHKVTVRLWCWWIRSSAAISTVFSIVWRRLRATDEELKGDWRHHITTWQSRALLWIIWAEISRLNSSGHKTSERAFVTMTLITTNRNTADVPSSPVSPAGGGVVWSARAVCPAGWPAAATVKAVYRR